MSINHTILGMLSHEPMTGYELKKIMQGASFMPWSGNNNQIYKALLELADSGYVTGETRHEESAPSKKVYTITAAGIKELEKWLKESPESFEVKKPFLLQLAWADILSKKEIMELLDQYKQMIDGQIFIEKKKAESGFFSVGQTERETVIWRLIETNIVNSYEAELKWIENAKKVLVKYDDPKNKSDKTKSKAQGKENKEMTYEVITKSNQSYILLPPNGKTIENEQDVMDLLSLCFENGVNAILISSERLSENFMRLQTKLAGTVTQKFTQYHIKAGVLLDESKTEGRFGEFLRESNRGEVFKSFNSTGEAERWLLK